mmetsp:Transcript_39331/g.58428  ORF Transcript_39331/g.58428 Transcript_39331/m.58428 type:complete len:156 (-) Transcript_39331:85-552(-)
MDDFEIRVECLWLHHLSAVALIGILLVYAVSDERVDLRGVIHYCAVACPSYSCVPKLCRLYQVVSSELAADVVWCTALLLWVFGRFATLHYLYGFAFYRLRDMTAPWIDEVTLDSPSYYVSVVVTVLLFAVYALNLYWSFGKLQSVQSTIAKHIR